MAVMRSALLWASRNDWLAQRFPRYGFAQAAVRRFMPGTTADAALGAAQAVSPAGIGSVLTRLGENIRELDGAAGVTRHYLDVLDGIAQRSLPACISVKLTQLGLDIDRDAAPRNLCALLSRAAALGNVVWVDMEDSSYVDRTLAMFREILVQYRNVGLCVQAYLHRTERDLASLLRDTAAIRLVKGAYNEPPTVAFPRKSDVDRNYERLARMLFAAARTHTDTPRPVLGTHDIPLIERLARTAETEGLPRDGYQIHMLYGIRAADQHRLARAGHHVSVLISYGEEWFPWYVRRLAERPANMWFMVKSLVG